MADTPEALDDPVPPCPSIENPLRLTYATPDGEDDLTVDAVATDQVAGLEALGWTVVGPVRTYPSAETHRIVERIGFVEPDSPEVGVEKPVEDASPEDDHPTSEPEPKKPASTTTKRAGRPRAAKPTQEA